MRGRSAPRTIALRAGHQGGGSARPTRRTNEEAPREFFPSPQAHAQRPQSRINTLLLVQHMLTSALASSEGTRQTRFFALGGLIQFLVRLG